MQRNPHKSCCRLIMFSATSRHNCYLLATVILATLHISAALQTTNDHIPASSNQTCNYPGSPAHASVTFNTSQIVAGTAASYTCDNGYELLGPPRRYCQANGTWSPVGIPFCVLNVGLGKAAMQSSTAGHGSAQKAVDGSTSPYFQASTCTMTDVESSPWWYVNLLEPYLVQIVRIDFGQACCANRQKATIAVRVGNNRPDLGNNPLCNRYTGFIEEGKPLFLPCTRPAPGAFVSIHLESPSGSSLSICETFIYTDHALSIEQCPSFRDQPLGSTATYNGKCYLFHNNQALTFDSARRYCESRGGTLVDETSPALQGFLSWELYRRHRNEQQLGQYWLGATRDPRNPKNWKWINGKEVQISFWNELNNQGNCSRFDGGKGWLWTDTDCQTQLNFICQYRPLSCGKPEKPTNSTLLTRNIDNGTVIEYQCAPGSVLMGPKSRACLPTGFFSEFAPKCKHVDCQLPATIPNGDYKLHNGTTTYSSIVTYACADGFQLYGRATLTCDVDERWNGPPPRCEPLLCPAPVPPSNGHVTVTSNITTPGVRAAYECRAGYELVGDHLLTCLSSGSWDNSFPYCREKRSPIAAAPVAVPTPAPARQQPARIPPQQPSSAIPASASNRQNGVLFPSAAGTNAPFSSNRLLTTTTATASTAATPTPAAAMSSSTPLPHTSPASLNGIAHQFVHQQQQQPSPLPPTPVAVTNQLATDNQVITAETRDRAKPQPTGVSSQISPSVVGQPSDSPLDVQPTRFTSRPPSPSGSFTLNPLATSTSQQPPPRQTTTPKFHLVPATSPSGGGASDSSPLATTNSISVSSSSHPSSSFSTGGLAASSSSATPTSLLMPTSNSYLQQFQQHVQQPQNFSAHHVLASFSGPPPPAVVRHSTHNTLASAKYSLDGIIAVAIFGGFIFLGAIITIIVIIIRRKSGRSSTIDAQTISTYDSNGGAPGEHNGLYRNYQQAWENLRFATPSSQPKLSGVVHQDGGPSAALGLKNFASGAGMGLGMHHHQAAAAAAGLHHASLLHGHHNLAMATSDTSTSSGGSESSSVLNGDPLLARHHARSHAHQHDRRRSMQLQHQQEVEHYHHDHRDHDHNHEDDDDEDDEGEQGILSSDEANYLSRRAAADGGHGNEGFRDSNELTINADTALVSQRPGQSTARRRIYSANSIGRAAAAAVVGSAAASQSNRLSTGNISSHHLHGHHHHHHLHHHHGGGGNSAASSQHQRLVSSSTPSESTRSSRASPPSGDDQSLDRLAYGNAAGWRSQNASNK